MLNKPVISAKQPHNTRGEAQPATNGFLLRQGAPGTAAQLLLPSTCTRASCLVLSEGTGAPTGTQHRSSQPCRDLGDLRKGCGGKVGMGREPVCTLGSAASLGEIPGDQDSTTALLTRAAASPSCQSSCNASKHSSKTAFTSKPG